MSATVPAPAPAPASASALGLGGGIPILGAVLAPSPVATPEKVATPGAGEMGVGMTLSRSQPNMSLGLGVLGAGAGAGGNRDSWDVRKGVGVDGVDSPGSTGTTEFEPLQQVKSNHSGTSRRTKIPTIPARHTSTSQRTGTTSPRPRSLYNHSGASSPSLSNAGSSGLPQISPRISSLPRWSDTDVGASPESKVGKMVQSFSEREGLVVLDGDAFGSSPGILNFQQRSSRKSPENALGPGSPSKAGVGVMDEAGFLVPLPPVRRNRQRAETTESHGVERETVVGLNSAPGSPSTVGQRRQQPDLKIEPPPAPDLGLSARGLTESGLQPPHVIKREASSDSGMTQYHTPPMTISATVAGSAATREASANTTPGSGYTRLTPNLQGYVEGPSPPIPARNPLRRRDGTPRSTVPGTPSGTSTPGSMGGASSQYATPRGTIAQASALLGAVVDGDYFDKEQAGSQSLMAPPDTARSIPSDIGSEITVGPLGASSSGDPGSAFTVELGHGSRDASSSKAETPTTADLVAVIGYSEQLDAKAPNTEKVLPQTPEGHTPPSGISETLNRLPDERHMYPQRGGQSLRPTASASNLTPSPTRSPSLPNSMSSIPPPSSRSGVPLRITVNGPAGQTNGDRTTSGPAQAKQRSPLIHGRSHSNPVSPALQSSTASSPGTMTPSTRTTKRAHLIKEICTTERSYANDLALVRDAYIRRIRPMSQYSSGSTRWNGGTSPGAFSAGSRVSAFTFETAETSATSYEASAPGHGSGNGDLKQVDSSESQARPKMDRSPSAYSTGNGSGGNSRPPSGYSTRPHSGHYAASLDVSAFPVAPPVPRARLPTIDALSPSDMRTVFLNLEEMVTFAEELATAFEKAVGDGTGNEPILKDGQEDTGTDSLGAVFNRLTPKMSGLYTTYCARQAQANTRLLELMQDPKTLNHLNDCWASIQPFTNAWDLGSMLIKPVQRVMKYPLLFGDLLNCTSPVHPDYFNLRKAFESATAIAGDINEVKRRKDVVDRMMKKRPSSSGSNNVKEPKVFGMTTAKLREKFGKNKDKDKGASTPSPTASLTIVPGSDRQLYDFVSRLDAADGVVRKVGKEINGWPHLVRDTWIAQKEMMVSWASIIRLDGSDAGDERIDAYASMIDDVLEEPWTRLDQEVRDTIMPTFSTLLRIMGNPKALIQKRESRLPDYIKTQTARTKSDLKQLDKSTLSSAEDFVALHVQLLEELPAFIEGHGRILDLALLAFSKVQARFYDGVRGKLREYMLSWAANQAVVDADGNGSGGEVQIESMDGRAVVKNWHQYWQPMLQQIEGLALIRNAPQKLAPTRRPSQSSTNTSSPQPHLRSLPPSLSRTASLKTNQSTENLFSPPLRRSESKIGRGRASSLMGQMFGNGNGIGNGSTRNLLGMTSSSNSQVSPVATAAFGGAAGGIVGMGIGSGNGSTESFSTASLVSNPNATRPSAPNGFTIPVPIPIPNPTASATSSASSRTQVANAYPNPTPNPNRPHSYLPPLSLPDMNLGASPPNERGMTDWKDQGVLYQCCCVAQFSLEVEIWYAGLVFLNMEEGDIIDILNEVGRVDQLADLPIDVGVPDDGLLVGRSKAGEVGLILCSFLEPLK